MFEVQCYCFREDRIHELHMCQLTLQGNFDSGTEKQAQAQLFILCNALSASRLRALLGESRLIMSQRVDT